MFLTEMEGNNWIGYILVGLRGTGKTVLTESIGKAHGVPTISMDTGKMMKGIVGESQRAFREAFRTIKSIGGNRVIVFATANRLDVLPPELLRRFKLGIVFFDLPTNEERASLWPVYLKKYGHDLKSEQPNDEGWTGSDIRNCCEIAYLTRKKIKQVGESRIVAVSKYDPESVKLARQQAHNRFLSASYPGAYQNPAVINEPTMVGTPTSRKLSLGGN
jgi:SpoVK/Ycf46/Vps4 family AAA+-type ATPase